MKFNNRQTDLKQLRKLFPCNTYLTISWDYGRTIGKLDRFIIGGRNTQYICQYGVDASNRFWTNHRFGVGGNDIRLSTDTEIEFLEKIREKEILKNS